MGQFNDDHSTEFKVYNLTLALPNVEYSQVTTSAVRKVSIQCRSEVDIKFSFIPGAIAAGLYQTIKAGAEKFLDKIYLRSQQTLYFETTSNTSPIVEIEVWR